MPISVAKACWTRHLGGSADKHLESRQERVRKSAEDQSDARNAPISRSALGFYGLPPLWISSSLCINSVKCSMNYSKAGKTGWRT
jgi:hypothetical protein